MKTPEELAAELVYVGSLDPRCTGGLAIQLGPRGAVPCLCLFAYVGMAQFTGNKGVSVFHRGVDEDANDGAEEVQQIVRRGIAELIRQVRELDRADVCPDYIAAVI